MIIVSSDERCTDQFLNAIILTDEPKGRHDVAVTCGAMMYANCDAIRSTHRSKLGDYIRIATDAEIRAINEEIARTFGLNADKREDSSNVEEELLIQLDEANARIKELEESKARADEAATGAIKNTADMIRVTAERNAYKELNDKLLDLIAQKG